jgi:hypothetical protein
MGLPRPITGIALVFNIYMMLVPHRKHPYGPPPPVTGIALLSFVDGVRTSRETHIWASTTSYVDSFTFLLLIRNSL